MYCVPHPLVRGIEWIGMDRLVTHGYPPASNNNTQVRNELSIVLLKTGQVISLKKGDNGYSSPITAIRVSPHRWVWSQVHVVDQFFKYNF